MRDVKRIGDERVMAAIVTFRKTGMDSMVVNRSPRTFDLEPIDAWVPPLKHIIEKQGITDVGYVVVRGDVKLVAL